MGHNGITRRVRWHDLRHTCASSLIAGWWGRRWSLEEVKGLLGHSSVKITERYAHLADSVLDVAASTTAGKTNGSNGSSRRKIGAGGDSPSIARSASADYALNPTNQARPGRFELPTTGSVVRFGVAQMAGNPCLHAGLLHTPQCRTCAKGKETGPGFFKPILLPIHVRFRGASSVVVPRVRPHHPHRQFPASTTREPRPDSPPSTNICYVVTRDRRGRAAD